MSIYAAITMWAIFIGYAMFIAEEYGVLTSVSASSYKLTGRSRMIFTAVLWAIGLLNIAFMDMGWWGAVASVGILYSGLTVNHEHEIGGPLHMIGTVGAIVSTFIGFWALYGVSVPAISMLVGSVVIYLWQDLKVRSKWIWWVEIYAMTLTMLTYLWVRL